MTPTPTRLEDRMELEPDDAGDLTVLEMVQPMVGFPDHRRFALTRLDESGLVCDLRAVDDELRFVVVPPVAFFTDYAPEIDDSVVDQLGIESADDVVVLLVVTLGETLESATANLMAPVLVNHRTRRAGQFLLDDVDLPLRAPLAPVGAG